MYVCMYIQKIYYYVLVILKVWRRFRNVQVSISIDLLR